MKQNTEEWLQWRRKGIGASDVPAIMGVSPWKTAHQLWQEKLGLGEEKKPDEYIVNKGHRLEVIARAKFELTRGVDFPPALAEQEENPHYRASLDGLNKETNTIMEVKYVGKKDWDDPAVPVKYYPQIQWQLFVTGAKHCWYVKINDKEEIKASQVNPSLVYIKEKMLPAVEDFWHKVKNGISPIKTNKDSEVSHDKLLLDYMTAYAFHSDQAKRQKEMAEQLKEKIIIQVKHEKTEIAGWYVQKVKKVGAVDYKKVPELQGVDLAPYRKKSTEFWTIRKAAATVRE